MFINQQSKVVFFHIPKTGGRSIKATFGFKESKRDRRLSHYLPETAREVIFQETWHHYWKFCIVRNPWDRFVSLYEFHRQSEHSKRYTPDLHRFAMANTFEQWFYANHSRVFHTDWFASPQHAWWTECDRVFQFENLAQAYREISSYIQPQGALVHENATERKPYHSYYKHASIVDQVAKMEARTIDLMGYTFE
jgi:hypothetical protein